MKTLYTAHGSVTGGREGRSASSDAVLDVTLTSVPGMKKDEAEALVQTTDVVCPYSHATKGNIQKTLSVA